MSKSSNKKVKLSMTNLGTQQQGKPMKLRIIETKKPKQLAKILSRAGMHLKAYV